MDSSEAGEFIYKTVTGVEGVYQLRPRRNATDNELSHLYAIEAPYDYLMEGGSNEPAFRFTFEKEKHFLFFETPRLHEVIDTSRLKFRHPTYGNSPPAEAKVARYAGYDGDVRSLRKEFDTQRQARYGFTWRGILRQHDLEFGIAGGELIVIDLETSEVLGVRRNYTKSGFMKNDTGIWWLTAPSCPQVTYTNPFSKRIEKLPNNEFVFKVLRPVNRSTRREN